MAGNCGSEPRSRFAENLRRIVRVLFDHGTPAPFRGILEIIPREGLQQRSGTYLSTDKRSVVLNRKTVNSLWRETGNSPPRESCPRPVGNCRAQALSLVPYAPTDEGIRVANGRSDSNQLHAVQTGSHKSGFKRHFRKHSQYRARYCSSSQLLTSGTESLFNKPRSGYHSGSRG